jgi:hypothetical protein
VSVVAAAAFRVVRRFGAAASLADAPAPASSDASVDAVPRVVRRFGVAGATSAPASAPVVAAVAAAFRGARGFGAAFVAFAAVAFVVDDRVERRFGVAAVDVVSSISEAEVPITSSRTLADSGAVDRVVGRCVTWARSMASSSGGTSLHGSVEDERGAAASRARSAGRLYDRSSRPGDCGTAVRPLTSG